jgi:hypothetical protein
MTAAPRAAAPAVRFLRRTSEREFLGLPYLSIAIGPDPSRGEARGHARGVIAIGDVATGFVAIGGMARGFLAIGGVAIGVLALGGLAVGALVAFGGGAIGGLAIGGGALGVVAIGGGAVGYYASGGAAFGAHTMSPLGASPEAVAFFRRLQRLLP